MLLRYLKKFCYFLLAILLLVFLLLLSDGIHTYSTPPPPSRLLLRKPTQKVKSTTSETRLNELKKRFGKSKELPLGFEEQALIALSFYPELEEIPIRFEIVETLIPLASRPDITSVLFPWEERTYCVVISSKSIESLEPILLHNLSFNAQVGVIGHELAHTVFYLDKSSIEHTGIAFKYLSSSFRKEFERATDYRTIEHGLGYQLLAWAEEVNKAFGGDTYESSMENTYYSPEEIKDAMKGLQMYR